MFAVDVWESVPELVEARYFDSLEEAQDYAKKCAGPQNRCYISKSKTDGFLAPMFKILKLKQKLIDILLNFRI